MVKKWTVRLGILLVSVCPYVFWGMYADAADRSMKIGRASCRERV